MDKNSIFTANTKMADVIHTNYLLLPVINRFGIKLGFGDKSVEQVCTEKNINLSFFLDILNTYNDKDYMPMEKMQNYPVDMIVDYLKETHNYYRNKALPEIEELVKRLVISCEEDCDNLKLIENFYSKYKEELLVHLSNEEEKFFPYVLELIKTGNSNLNLKQIKNKYSFSYTGHNKEHEAVVAKLFDLKNIIIKYLPPNYNQGLGNNLLSALFVLDKDLIDHERLEDVILLPALKELESQFE